MPEQFGEKKHDATPHRRQEARQQGNVAKSQDLSSAALLVGALIVFWFVGESMVSSFLEYMREQLGGEMAFTADEHFTTNRFARTVYMLGHAMLPFLGLLFVIAVLSNLLQTGLLFLPNKLSADFGRVNPIKGIGRLFSMTNVVRLGFGVFKILVVVSVAAFSLWGERESILGLGSLAVPQLAVFLSQVTFWTCLKIGIALLVLAIFDFVFQRWKNDQDLRMTDQELREEIKTQQGDPQIQARRRAVQQQLVRNRISSSVPNADVIVTNPTELAIAIKYDITSMNAPVVVAKGAGSIAQRIRRMALENNIPVVERKELAQTLYREVDINQEVPAQQYAAVAEVLRYVYELKGLKVPGLDNAA